MKPWQHEFRPVTAVSHLAALAAAGIHITQISAGLGLPVDQLCGPLGSPWWPAREPAETLERFACELAAMKIENRGLTPGPVSPQQVAAGMALAAHRTLASCLGSCGVSAAEGERCLAGGRVPLVVLASLMDELWLGCGYEMPLPLWAWHDGHALLEEAYAALAGRVPVVSFSFQRLMFLETLVGGGDKADEVVARYAAAHPRFGAGREADLREELLRHHLDWREEAGADAASPGSHRPKRLRVTRGQRCIVFGWPGQSPGAKSPVRTGRANQSEVAVPALRTSPATRPPRALAPLVARRKPGRNIVSRMFELKLRQAGLSEKAWRARHDIRSDAIRHLGCDDNLRDDSTTYIVAAFRNDFGVDLRAAFAGDEPHERVLPIPASMNCPGERLHLALERAWSAARREILDHLASDPASLTDLAAHFRTTPRALERFLRKGRFSQSTDRCRAGRMLDRWQEAGLQAGAASR